MSDQPVDRSRAKGDHRPCVVSIIPSVDNEGKRLANVGPDDVVSFGRFYEEPLDEFTVYIQDPDDPEDTVPAKSHVAAQVAAITQENWLPYLNINIVAYYIENGVQRFHQASFRVTAANTNLPLEPGQPSNFPEARLVPFTDVESDEFRQIFPCLQEREIKEMVKGLTTQKKRDKATYWLVTAKVNMSKENASTRVFAQHTHPHAKTMSRVADALRRQPTIQVILAARQFDEDIKALNEAFTVERQTPAVRKWFADPENARTHYIENQQLVSLANRPHISAERMVTFPNMLTYALAQYVAHTAELEAIESNSISTRTVGVFIRIATGRTRTYMGFIRKVAPTTEAVIEDGTVQYPEWEDSSPNISIGDKVFISPDPDDEAEPGWPASVVQLPSALPLNYFAVTFRATPLEAYDHVPDMQTYIHDPTDDDRARTRPVKLEDFTTLSDSRAMWQKLKDGMRTVSYSVPPPATVAHKRMVKTLRALTHVNNKYRIGDTTLRQLLCANDLLSLPRYNAYAVLEDANLADVLGYATRGLNTKQLDVMRDTLSALGGLQICVGPPGTGKTHIIPRLILPFLLLPLKAERDEDTKRNPIENDNAILLDEMIKRQSDKPPVLKPIQETRRAQVLWMTATNEGAEDAIQALKSYVPVAIEHFGGQVSRPYFCRLHSITTHQNIMMSGFVDRDLFADNDVGEQVFQACEEMAVATQILRIYQDSKLRQSLNITDKRVKDLESTFGYHCLGGLGLIDGYPYIDAELLREHQAAATNWRLLSDAWVDKKTRDKSKSNATGSQEDPMASPEKVTDPEQKSKLTTSFWEYQQSILGRISVLVATPHVLATPKFITTVKANMIISDEDARGHELLALTCLANQVNENGAHVALIGDPSQLQPRSESTFEDNAFKSQLSMSFMDRLIKAGFPTQQLVEQRRMASSICRLIANKYKEALETYPDNDKREMSVKFREFARTQLATAPAEGQLNLDSAAVRATGLNVALATYTGLEAWSGTTSKHNETSLNVSMWMVSKLVDFGFQYEDICIITFYRAQLSNYEAAIANNATSFPGITNLTVITADRCQGREFNIVIHDVVGTQKMGFISQEGRCLVSLSRARHGMILVMNTDALKLDPAFRRSELDSAFKYLSRYRYVFRVTEDEVANLHNFMDPPEEQKDLTLVLKKPDTSEAASTGELTTAGQEWNAGDVDQDWKPEGADQAWNTEGADQAWNTEGADQAWKTEGADQTWNTQGSVSNAQDAGQAWKTEGAGQTWNTQGSVSNAQDADQAWKTGGADQTWKTEGADQAWKTEGADQAWKTEEADLDW